MVRTPPNVELFFHCLWLSDNHSVVTTCASAGTFEKSGDLSPSWNRVYIVGLFWMVCVLDAGCSFFLVSFSFGVPCVMYMSPQDGLLAFLRLWVPVPVATTSFTLSISVPLFPVDCSVLCSFWKVPGRPPYGGRSCPVDCPLWSPSDPQPAAAQ